MMDKLVLKSQEIKRVFESGFRLEHDLGLRKVCLLHLQRTREDQVLKIVSVDNKLLFVTPKPKKEESEDHPEQSVPEGQTTDPKNEQENQYKVLELKCKCKPDQRDLKFLWDFKAFKNEIKLDLFLIFLSFHLC